MTRRDLESPGLSGAWPPRVCAWHYPVMCGFPGSLHRPVPLAFALFISFLCPRFAPGLSCVTYVGDKEERAHLQQDLRQESRFHVLLTTYEVTVCVSSKNS